MIKYILKMLWAQKRDYSGIFVEQGIVAFILMLSVVSVSDAIQKYQSPGMLDVENTICVGHMFQRDVLPEEMSIIQQSENVILGHLKKLPYVEAVSTGYNLTPYLRNNHLYNYFSDSIHIDDKTFLSVLKLSDEYGVAVFKPDMEEGTWIENHALPDGSVPVVVTHQFVEQTGWPKAVGKKLLIKGKENTIVGVVAGLKQEPLMPSPVAVIIPNYIALSQEVFLSENIVNVKQGKKKELMIAFNKEFRRLISDKRVEPLVTDLQSLKDLWISSSIIGITLQVIPSLFLFIFAFIGTFGLYWMTSRKRLKEFALRIALGSDKKQLVSIVVTESLIVTAMAVIPALTLSFFIYEYTMMHVIAISIMVLAMLLFSFVSAWYPAWQVSQVNPAEALQYE
jgi:hypothetical protein